MRFAHDAERPLRIEDVVVAGGGGDGNGATRGTRFLGEGPAPADLILLCVWAAAFLLAGRALFVKKEV